MLDQFGTALQRVRELACRAATPRSTTRRAWRLRASCARSATGCSIWRTPRTANGEHLFAGFRTASRPFVRNGSGDVEYLGDQGQRHVDLSPDRAVAVGDSGDALHDRTARERRALSCCPRRRIPARRTLRWRRSWTQARSTTSPTSIAFLGGDNYELRNGATVVASGTLAPGQALDFAGRRVVFCGRTAAGDTFLVDAAGQTSIFDVVDDLAALLEAPGQSAAAGAKRTDALTVALQSIDQSLNRTLELRTDVGARLQAIDDHGLVNEDSMLELKTALSGVEDLDYADAISRFQMQQVALQADSRRTYN